MHANRRDDDSVSLAHLTIAASAIVTIAELYGWCLPDDHPTVRDYVRVLLNYRCDVRVALAALTGATPPFHQKNPAHTTRIIRRISERLAYGPYTRLIPRIYARIFLSHDYTCCAIHKPYVCL
jgi:hypothetical protein